MKLHSQHQFAPNYVVKIGSNQYQKNCLEMSQPWPLTLSKTALGLPAWTKRNLRNGWAFAFVSCHMHRGRNTRGEN